MFVVFNWQQHWMKWALNKPKKEEKKLYIKMRKLFLQNAKKNNTEHVPDKKENWKWIKNYFSFNLNSELPFLFLMPLCL